MKGIRLNTRTCSDAVYVEGVYRRDPVMERALHYHCKHYFDKNYRSVFFVGSEYKDEIFHEAFITLWENIVNHKIYVEDGILKGRDGREFSGQLTTYFMSIARLKYLEWARQHSRIESIDSKEERCPKEQESSDDDAIRKMQEIVASCIAHMSERCSQILTLFYYKKRTLDDIMTELPSFQSKDALKTAKYKCIETLRKNANEIYRQHLYD